MTEKEVKKKADKGVVLQMQDYSIHDGDGVRTTIFLAGCPLRCKWCANPESWTMDGKLSYHRHKCISCGRCFEVCPQGIDPRMSAGKKACTACGKCTEVCPQNALAILCVEKSVDEILAKIKRDALFFYFTGGGVTFSGGEPMMQHPFLRQICQELEKLGIDMWVETCGWFDWDTVSDIFEKFSHVFVDLKFMDPKKHKAYTGVSNERILENIRQISKAGIPLTVRIPVMEGVNLTEENMIQTAVFLKELDAVSVELLPYHELAKSKYIALGLEDQFVSFVTPTREQIEKAYAIFGGSGIRVVEYR